MHAKLTLDPFIMTSERLNNRGDSPDLSAVVRSSTTVRTRVQDTVCSDSGVCGISAVFYVSLFVSSFYSAAWVVVVGASLARHLYFNCYFYSPSLKDCCCCFQRTVLV